MTLGEANAYTALTANILAKAIEKGMAAEDFTRLYGVYEELVRAVQQAQSSS